MYSTKIAAVVNTLQDFSKAPKPPTNTNVNTLATAKNNTYGMSVGTGVGEPTPINHFTPKNPPPVNKQASLNEKIAAFLLKYRNR